MIQVRVNGCNYHITEKDYEKLCLLKQKVSGDTIAEEEDVLRYNEFIDHIEDWYEIDDEVEVFDSI